jgi:hypothetical protein
VFYPWRAWDFTRNVVQWTTLALRHRRMRKRIQHDPRSADYIDESLRATTEGSNRPDEFIEVYADKIPATHGAPKRQKAVEKVAAA